MSHNRLYNAGQCVVAGAVGSFAVVIMLYTVGVLRQVAEFNDICNREVLVHATAAHGSETFAIVTAAADANTDVVFCLDFLTGDLTGMVLHPKQGKIVGTFKANVTKALPSEAGKRPSYVMTTGRVASGPQQSAVKPGGSAVYVADCNTGKVAVYSFPWANTFGKAIARPMDLLEIIDTREVKLEK